MAMHLDAQYQYMDYHDLSVTMFTEPNSAVQSKVFREDMEIASRLQDYLIQELIEDIMGSLGLEQKLEAIEKLSEWIEPTHHKYIADLKRICIHEKNVAVRNSLKDLIDALSF
ncbi:MAG: hypothetical protein D6732_14980 [Methanobacteriota archaeon]|nr:MAG: hypothetical protein D6732_14980 [Euryarchaeota archaeon]